MMPAHNNSLYSTTKQEIVMAQKSKQNQSKKPKAKKTKNTKSARKQQKMNDWVSEVQKSVSRMLDNIGGIKKDLSILEHQLDIEDGEFDDAVQSAAYSIIDKKLGDDSDPEDPEMGPAEPDDDIADGDI